QSTKAIIGVSAIGLVGLFWLTYMAARSAGVELTVHSWIAIGLGSIGSLLVSAILFGLTFHSSRSGHDDKIEARK
ncbi:MAG: hypothetical protein AAGJ50_11305, partial [Pseudomonadota bacterium]